MGGFGNCRSFGRKRSAKKSNSKSNSRSVSRSSGGRSNGSGKRSFGKRRPNPLAALAMKLHYENGMPLKEAWRQVNAGMHNDKLEKKDRKSPSSDSKKKSE